MIADVSAFDTGRGPLPDEYVDHISQAAAGPPVRTGGAVQQRCWTFREFAAALPWPVNHRTLYKWRERRPELWERLDVRDVGGRWMIFCTPAAFVAQCRQVPATRRRAASGAALSDRRVSADSAPPAARGRPGPVRRRRLG